MLKPYLPYNIDHGTEVKNPLINNLFYLSVWAMAHSTFARQTVKVYVTRIIPRHLERSFYVFQSSYLLHQGKTYCKLHPYSSAIWFLVIKNWAPMPEVVYEIPDDFKAVFVVIYCFGWMFLGIVSILQA